MVRHLRHETVSNKATFNDPMYTLLIVRDSHLARQILTREFVLTHSFWSVSARGCGDAEWREMSVDKIL